VCLRFAGKCLRVFERERLDGVSWQAGCFAQDAVGDWWLCLPVKVEAEESIAPQKAVGIDLGLKDIAVTSEGECLEAGRWTLRLCSEAGLSTAPWPPAPGQAHSSQSCALSSGCSA
jgi:hypothetical protein